MGRQKNIGIVIISGKCSFLEKWLSDLNVYTKSSGDVVKMHILVQQF